MHLTALFGERTPVEAVVEDLQGAGVGAENIFLYKWSGEQHRDTLQEEFSELDFVKAELDIFMDTRPVKPDAGVVTGSLTGLVISVVVPPGQKDEVIEILSKYRPWKIVPED